MGRPESRFLVGEAKSVLEPLGIERTMIEIAETETRMDMGPVH